MTGKRHSQKKEESEEDTTENAEIEKSPKSTRGSSNPVDSKRQSKSVSRHHRKRSSADPGSSRSYTKRASRSSRAFASGSLRDTLSEFRDEVIRVKDPDLLNPQQKYDETVIPMPLDQDLFPQPFERVSSKSVGTVSSRWHSVIHASTFTSRSRTQQSTGKTDDSDAHLPSWKVPGVMRRQMTLLGSSVIVHELACFLSCVLVGLLLWQALLGLSWMRQESTVVFSFMFTCMYRVVTTICVIVTAIGFLCRIDTCDPRNLCQFFVFLLPTLTLVALDYMNKALDLQTLECQEFAAASEEAKKRIHLTYICSETKNFKGPYDLSRITLLILPALLSTGIALYLYCNRHNFYLVTHFQKEPKVNYGGWQRTRVNHKQRKYARKENLIKANLPSESP